MNTVHSVAEVNSASQGKVWRVAEAELPSRFGDFRVVAYESAEGKDYVAVVKGDVRGMSDVSVRVHSECLTGDVMGSL